MLQIVYIIAIALPYGMLQIVLHGIMMEEVIEMLLSRLARILLSSSDLYNSYELLFER